MTAGPALEMWSRQSGSVESPDGKQRRASFVRAFTVTLDATDSIEESLNASGLPLVNDKYPGTLFVICRRLTPTRISPVLAMVQADYAGEVGKGGVDDSPTSNEVVITWRSSITDQEIDQDINGNPIVTKNNEPIYGITERIVDQMVTIERNFLAINIYSISDYLRSRNSDSFLGWPPGTVRIMDYSATNVITDGAAGFWRVQATFECRFPYNTTADRAWWKRVRHEGFLVRPSASEDPIIARDTEGSPLTQMTLLKEDGTKETDPANAHWLEFETTAALPYSALGLID